MGSPFDKTAPGSFNIFSTRALTGDEITRSNSGTTVPEAVIVASISPVSTFAVRMRARATDGLINRGPQMKTAATRAADRTATITRRINRFRRNVMSISRSIFGLSPRSILTLNSPADQRANIRPIVKRPILLGLLRDLPAALCESVQPSVQNRTGVSQAGRGKFAL